MGPDDVELVRLGRSGRRPAAVVAIAVLFVAAAVLKPWQIGGGGVAQATASDEAAVATERVLTATAHASPTLGSSPVVLAEVGNLCQSPEGWSIVSDDTELGRSVRTWTVASVVFTTAQPATAAIPITTLFSATVTRLGLCLPADVVTSDTSWTATVWHPGIVVSTNPATWSLVAELHPQRGERGGLLDATGIVSWQPGLYVVSALFPTSGRQAWLAVDIKA